jgi:2-dehydro-3-deoxyphosphogluconate aldolase/(4S)-4-hydroxy-2-oxoglutarate aldolase
MRKQGGGDKAKAGVRVPTGVYPLRCVSRLLQNRGASAMEVMTTRATRRTRAEIVSLLVDACIIAVVRADKAEQVVPICDALLAGGVSALEITLTVPKALELIREVSQQFGARAIIGAGTVINVDGCRSAITAGAEFIVSPITRAALIHAAHDADRPAMIGAYTPTEAQTAHEAGADFIKIFPADKLGPAYIKAIRAPLPHLRIVPTGGVDLTTAADFLKAGCVALGVGSSLMTKDVLSASNWSELTRLAQAFVAAVRAARAGK